MTHRPMEDFAEAFERSGLAFSDTLSRFTEPRRNLAWGQTVVITQLEQLAIIPRQSCQGTAHARAFGGGHECTEGVGLAGELMIRR